MSRWTATRIAEHMTSLLHDVRLIVVSNREPYSHRWHRPAPLESSPAPLSSAGTAPWDFGWIRRLPSQVSRMLQGGHCSPLESTGWRSDLCP